jgi:hypothetical protein
MANILSYFLININDLDQIYYGHGQNNYDMFLHYKNKYFFILNIYQNKYNINNYNTNIYKQICKDTKTILAIITNKFLKDITYKCFMIYYYSDNKINKFNRNTIKYLYDFINKIRYKIYIGIIYDDNYYIENKYYYVNNSIIIYNDKKLTNCFYNSIIVLIPNKYELYYYSNYFHIF